MHLTRFGFNAIVLVWLIPAIVMDFYGNTVATGAESDLYYWKAIFDAALAAYSLFQLFRKDETMSLAEASKRKADAKDDVVSFENLGSLEYLYCALLFLVALGSWWFHHDLNKNSTGALSIATLLWSWLDILVAAVAGMQFYRLKSGAIVEVSKKLVTH